MFYLFFWYCFIFPLVRNWWGLVKKRNNINKSMFISYWEICSCGFTYKLAVEINYNKIKRRIKKLSINCARKVFSPNVKLLFLFFVLHYMLKVSLCSVSRSNINSSNNILCISFSNNGSKTDKVRTGTSLSVIVSLI